MSLKIIRGLGDVFSRALGKEGRMMGHKFLKLSDIISVEPLISNGCLQCKMVTKQKVLHTIFRENVVN